MSPNFMAILIHLLFLGPIVVLVSMEPLINTQMLAASIFGLMFLVVIAVTEYLKGSWAFSVDWMMARRRHAIEHSDGPSIGMLTESTQTQGGELSETAPTGALSIKD